MGSSQPRLHEQRESENNRAENPMCLWHEAGPIKMLLILRMRRAPKRFAPIVV